MLKKRTKRKYENEKEKDLPRCGRPACIVCLSVKHHVHLNEIWVSIATPTACTVSMRSLTVVSIVVPARTHVKNARLSPYLFFFFLISGDVCDTKL